MTQQEQQLMERLREAALALRKTRTERDTLALEKIEPIAVVGAGCRFPGGADSPDAYWDLLEAGRDAIQPLDKRWALIGAQPGEDVPRWAGLLDGSVDAFDAAFFGISPREARSLDPQHRLLLEVAWEALEDAGIPPRSLEGSRAGVFVGACSTDYAHVVSHLPREEQDAYSATGNMVSVLAGRLSYTLGLQGPCVTIDTACSSSLVAIHLACRSLRARESDLALAGGVNVLLSPITMEGVGRTQALSPDGRCRTFDAAANGFVRGEGCGLVALKRRSDALRDGDRIWALIRGSAINQDGRSTGMTAPNVRAQEAVLREALQGARVDAGAISYVETHGTGTSLGDPIEVEALRAVLGAARADGSRCVLGAVKTNLGHLEAAAGVAGLIKVLLSLRQDRIPRNLNFRTQNPRLRLDGTALALATDPVPWPRGERPRFAGVSSFGLSGTNAHVVLEEAPAPAPAPGAPDRAAELFVLSARSPAALDAQASRLSAHLDAHPDLTLGDVAFSLATTRSAMDHRLAVTATSREGLRDALQAAAEGQTPPGSARGTTASSRGKLAFLFTGQGAQTPGMGKGLYEAWPAFREAFDRCAALFDQELERPLRGVMWAEPGSADAALLDQTEYAQPALFALEYALFALWRAWGVAPDMVAGHSIGELSAACVAGVFSLEDAVKLVAARGRLMAALPPGGSMVSIAASEADVATLVAPQAATVSIAAINGPEQVVIAGAEESVHAIARAFAARGVRTTALRVSHAFHSPLMAPMLEAFGRVAESVKFHRPSLALVSNVTGKRITEEACSPAYWVRHVREAVRFSDGVKALHEAGATTFIEVGPKATLLGLVPACLPDSAPALLASLRAGRDEAVSVLEALGGLWALGGAVDWSGLFPGGGRRVSLPAYPWQRERYWVEAPEGSLQGAGEATGHPLLGVRVPVAGAGAVFEAVLGLGTHPWLGDHRVAGQALVPAAALAELVRAAAAHGSAIAPPVRGLVLQTPLVLPETGARRVQVVLGETGAEGARVSVYSRPAQSAPGAGWTLHASAAIAAEEAPAPAALDLAALQARCPDSLDVAAVYAGFGASGVAYGPAFQGIRSLGRGDGESLAEVALPAGVSAEGYGVFPPLLDAAFQALVGASATESRDLLLPFEIGSFTVYQPGAEAAWVHVQLRGGSGGVVADVTLADTFGAVVAQVTELRFQRADREALRRGIAEAPPDAFYRLEWRDAPLPEAPPARPEGSWVVVAGPGSDLAAKLTARLGQSVWTEPSGLAATLAATSPIAGVICLWESGAADVPAAALRAATDGLSVVHALRDHGLSRLLWVTTGALAIEPGEAVNVETAPVWGLGRTVMAEHPELGCTLLDLAPGGDALDALEREISAQDGEDQIAFRAGRRRAARLSRVAAMNAEGPTPLSEQGTVLLTGGLGALGLHVARWLARQGVAHLVLTGRRGLDTPGAAEAVAELESLGARVTVAAVDVAHRNALGDVIAAIPPQWPLRGVIHAAGVLDDGVLAEQDAGRFERVFAPKVAGAWNLHVLTAEHALDFFVLFSSATGLLGAAGQGNYAAANTFLDALAAHRRARGLPGQSLAWGAWAEGGMAAALEAAQQARLSRQGARALTSAEGIALLEQAIRRPEAELGVLRLDLEVVSRALGATIPPVWRALVRAPAAPRASAQGAWANRLSALPPSRREEEVRATVRAEVARVLSLGAASAVPLDRPLSELGLDSLMAVELRNALAQRAGMALPATLAFDYPTVQALSRWLLDKVLVATDPRAQPAKAQPSAALDEPIAIVAMSCRLPGGVSDPEGFWRLLDEGIDAVTEVPRSRWDIDALYDPDPDAPGKVTTRSGGFLSDIDQFDPAFFGISPREAASMDPQQRLLLEASWEAFERAGQTPERLMGSDTGVFVGVMYQEYGGLAGGLEALDGYMSTGNAASIASGRISYVLGLKGPSMTVDTACSSSLVAIHLACQSLRSGECSMALAGGVALMLTPVTFVEFSRLRGLAPDGRCKSFSAAADGVGWSEGCSLLVLKRLRDAQRDGDPILALIRGTAVNQDGRSNGLTAPNGPSQEEVIRRALAQAGIAPADVGYVECHGTGTSLGDPIEVQALGAALGEGRAPDRPVVIGSVKSNLGHTQAAAGAAGIMKVVLALEHDRIPKSLHFDAPSPHIPWSDLPVKVASEAVEWRRNGAPRRAGVSSFGVSGTNAHVVLEEAPAAGSRQVAPDRAAELFVLSAKSAAALDAQASQLSRHLAARPDLGLGDVAFSLATARSAMDHRLAVAAGSREALLAALQAAAEGQTPPGAARGRASAGVPKVVFVFPGQGSQWVGMGRQLVAEEPVFRAALEACDRAIQAEAGWSVLAKIAAEESSSQLDRIDVVQPLLFAMEVALSALWRSWGVEPDAVVGHSMGEVAAAHVAGALSLADAVAVICRRSRLLRRISGQGEMAVVELSLAEAEAALRGYEDRLSVAVSNSPRSTVLSGEPSALAEVLSALEGRGVFCRRVKVDVASHSPQVDVLREDLLAALSAIAPLCAAVPMRSTVTGAMVSGADLPASYWADNLRKPVRFAEAVQALVESGHGLFVEVSPHPILTTSVEEIQRAARQEGAAVGSLRRGQAERAAMLEAVGSLWARGYPLSWERLFPAGGRRVPLPTYPWQRDRYWVEAPAERVADAVPRAHTSGHPLLGKAISVSTQAGLRLWETTLTVKRLPWLDDHRVQGAAVFPGAAYVEMALSAGAEVVGDGPIEITGAVFSEALAFSADAAAPVQVVMTEEQRGQLRFQIASRALSFKSAPFRVHAGGAVRRADHGEAAARLDLPALCARLGTSVPGAAAYEALAGMGLEYGPAFQGVVELWRGEGETLGRVRLPEAAGSAAAYRLHPALLDACFQVMGGALAGSGETSPWVPVEVGSLRFFQRPSGELWCHARRASRGPESRDRRIADFWVADSTGAVIVEVRGLVVQRLASGAPRREEDDWFLDLAWEPAAVPEPTTTAGRWLLLGGGEVGAALRAALEDAGHAAVHAPDMRASADGARALLTSSFGGQAPTAIVHLGSLDVGRALDAGTLEATLARGCDSVIALVQALAGTSFREAPRLWLVTRGAQAAGGGDVSATQAPLLGLGRVIGSEHAELRCARIDLDPARPGGEAGALLAELLGGDAEEEVALRGGERLVARLVRRPPEPERREKSEPAGDRPFRLEMDAPGALDRLVLRAAERRPPGPGEVEIAVEAAGLTFLDVMAALGEMPGDAGGPPVLGGECAGRITALGEGVQGLTVGQPVIAIVDGAFASHVTTSATLVLPRPAGLSAVEAASLPIAALMAYYALDRVARLQPGERVLIHAATGGVGLAAVQWAQHAGAEIYATASTPEKRAHLHALGVRHVSDSRTDRFVADVRAWTGGEGVDVVLNSLSGDLVPRSLDLLRDHGRFVEVGKRDFHTHNQLGLQPFLRNLSFSLVDLRGLVRRHPARGRALFEQVLGLVAQGVFTPLPITTLPITQAADAFWKMAEAQHIGKLVITLDHPEVRVRAPAEAPAAVRADGTYLVTGGLGGLGLSVAGWLADRGAGHLVLLGRSGAASAEQRAAVAALEARGARVTVARVDVADRAQLEQLIGEVSASGMPLRGVIHTAGVLDDGVIMAQSPARFRAVMAPKALGALHLHELTRAAPLDFFVLYASGAGLLGSPGQSNYAAANTFLDALAQHRRARGLPGLSIDWGLFADVGLAAAQENRGARLVSRGMRSLTAAEGLWALERLLEGDRAHAAVLPLDMEQWVELYPAALFSRVLSRLVAAQRADAGQRKGDRDLLDRLAAAEPAERAALLEALLRKQASEVLRIPEDKLDVNTALTSLGMDSLMGLELRNRIEAALGVAVPAALGWTYPTVAAMTRWLLDKALAGAAGEGGEGSEADAGAPAASAKGSVHLLHFRRVASPRARIFCFHGAGGSPEAFASWSAAPAFRDIEILALWHDRGLLSADAPGETYVEEAASLIQQHSDAPFALLGVSLGVRFAMATAYALAARPGAPAPRALFTLGGGLNALPINADLAAELLGKYFLIEQAAGQVRPTLQNHSDARIDLAITDTMGLILDDPRSPPSRLSAPIVAVAGTNDGIMPPGDVQDLEFRTTGRFYIHFLPGDHEFLIEREPEIMEIVGAYLDPLLGRAAPR